MYNLGYKKINVMSLESYKKTIEQIRKRELQNSDEWNQRSNSSINIKPNMTSKNYEKHSHNKSRSFKRMFIFIIFAVLLLAGFTNPSDSDAEEKIKSKILEVANKEMREKIRVEEDNVWKQIGSGLAILFAPAIIDNLVQIDVSNFIIFSTFDAKIPFEDEQKTLVSGIIIFGKILPTGSDIEKRFLE